MSETLNGSEAVNCALSEVSGTNQELILVQKTALEVTEAPSMHVL